MMINSVKLSGFWGGDYDTDRHMYIAKRYFLQVKEGASEKEVKDSYKRLLLQVHPDKCNDVGAGLAFQLISKAYNALKKQAAI